MARKKISLPKLLRVCALEEGPAMLTDRLRWQKGDELLLEVGVSGTVWIFRAGTLPGEARMGHGLILTCNPEERILVDGKRVNVRRKS